MPDFPRRISYAPLLATAQPPQPMHAPAFTISIIWVHPSPPPRMPCASPDRSMTRVRFQSGQAGLQEVVGYLPMSRDGREHLWLNRRREQRIELARNRGIKNAVRRAYRGEESAHFVGAVRRKLGDERALTTKRKDTAMEIRGDHGGRLIHHPKEIVRSS